MCYTPGIVTVCNSSGGLESSSKCTIATSETRVPYHLNRFIGRFSTVCNSKDDSYNTPVTQLITVVKHHSLVCCANDFCCIDRDDDIHIGSVLLDARSRYPQPVFASAIPTDYAVCVTGMMAVTLYL